MKIKVNSDDYEPAIKKINRKKCKYSIKCYRKDLLHFALYEHPDEHSFFTNKSSTPNDKLSQGHEPVEAKNILNINNIFLTKNNIKPSNFNELSLNEILSNFTGSLIKSVQFNYMFDCQWLIQEYPLKFRKCPLLLVHGNMFDSSQASLSNIELCQADLPIQYGTHHTKMMMLLYDEGLRIVIHTANLIPEDWKHRTQSIWMSDVFPILENKKISGDSSTDFKKDLIEYLSFYHKKVINDWISIIKEHDFSSCKVHFISSIPGRHQGVNLSKFGHLKLRRTLEKNLIIDNSPLGSDLVAQFSSIGSLGSSKDSWLCGEFMMSLSSFQNKNLTSSTEHLNLHLIYPCVEDVRKSVDGYLSGSSLPYSSNVHSKQLWIMPFFRKWRAAKSNRTYLSPHMKSYLRFSPQNSQLDWFLMTSANLSKAAWGNLEKKNSQLSIRSYEVGVLFIPKNYDVSNFSVCRDYQISSMYIPVPYDLPPIKYGDDDGPWLVDKDYKVPDARGAMWVH